MTHKSEECVHVSQNHELSVHDRDLAGDDALMWHFLALICQQNGVLVPSDISDLLMKEASLPTAKSPIRGVGVGGVTEDDALNEFRHFLLSGRKKVHVCCNGGDRGCDGGDDRSDVMVGMIGVM